MSRRLTNDDRRTIRKRLLEHAFAKREAALLKEENVLAAAAYDRVYPKKIRDLMAALPEGFLSEDESIRATVDGRQFDLKFSEPRRGRHGSPHYTTAKFFNVLGDDALGTKILAHANAEKALKEEQDKASSNIRAALLAMTTVKQCIERWPEARVFVEDLEKKPVTALAIPLRDLNRALGLPPA